MGQASFVVLCYMLRLVKRKRKRERRRRRGSVCFRGSEMFTFKKVLVNYVIICFYYLIGIKWIFLKVLEMDISRLLK